MATCNYSCCLCGANAGKYGNNPFPYGEEEDDKCCDECNWTCVIPARIGKFGKEAREEWRKKEIRAKAQRYANM